MVFIDQTNLCHRLGLALAAAVVLTALAGTIAAASAASPAGAPAVKPTLLDADPSPRSNESPNSQSPCTQANCVFVLDKGRFETIAPPGDPLDSLVGINNQGQIAGGYVEDDAEASHGYFRDRRGRFTMIDVPGAAGTLLYDLNDRRQIVGIYSNTNLLPAGADDTRGFLRDERGRFTTIHIRGAVRTQAFGINNRGQVVGEYLGADGRFHVYLWDKGQFTTFDGPEGAGASATDINDRSEIVGVFADRTDPGTLDGFLLSEGVYTTFDAPEPLTFPFGINNRGQVVGFTTTETGANGFLLAKGVGGPFTPIDFPGAPGTGATDINDRGQIVGIYGNPDATPSRERQPMRMPGMMSGR